ncbi:hypothetical protein K2173_024476 [Erythroxylum novogranatense]|uniref:Peroxisomal ATPase PEX1 n=1 Tax=Erythroxylum novogranatense TaxID=1862640 RepID=A0AAV8SUF2_9ROSI|nr:hypothetical protein K2173_024476 [Erythroxylum novogranatense]
MEFQVMHVSGIEDCFVSLPLILIQTLQSSRPALASQVLSLELRSTDDDGLRWTVAWSGATSASSSIEVARQFAECISLPDWVRVRIRVLSGVTSATLVTVEPNSEDDWEVLELNAEQAEAAILKQIRIVHEGMRFPLWLHGRTVVTFLVVSTSPVEAVVQLVDGTKFSVAPKPRKKEIKTETSMERNPLKVLLRLQDSDGRLFHKTDVKGLELNVALASVGYVHPETAKKFSLDFLLLVKIIPRLSLRETVKAPESDMLRMKNTSSSADASSGKFSDKKERQAVVTLLLSDSVARGHLMIARSLRLYLRASLYSWVYLKERTTYPKEDLALLSLSPCYFKMLGQDEVVDKNGVEVPDNNRFGKPKNRLLKPSSDAYIDAGDFSIHEKIVTALSYGPSGKGDEETASQPTSRKGLTRLAELWFLAQLKAIASVTGSVVNTLTLGTETLLHFEVKGYNFETDRIPKANGLSEHPLKATGAPVEFFYILTISEESPHNECHAYKIVFDENGKANVGGKYLFAKLKLGDPVFLYSPKERTSIKEFNSNISSLSWMGTAAKDVINRINVLLSPASEMWFSRWNLPLPGHVPIYGPHGSGKSILAKAVAKSLQEHKDVLAHTVFVDCSRLALENGLAIRQALSAYISEALDHAPSLIVFDDLDSIVPSSSDSERSQSSSSVVALTNFLADIMDEYGEKRKSSCGIGPIAFIASVQSLDSIPQSLSSSGRFDFHVQLPAPAAAERCAILKHEIQRRLLQCSDDILQDIASKCEGYDAYDLEILVDRAVHSAIGRFLPGPLSFQKDETPTLIKDDFARAMHEFLPVAMRDITKAAPESGHSGWDDVGGLSDIRNAIKEMIELPSKFPNIFVQAPLRLRSNVLLYGPPGCGKTHIVGAAAAACSLRFISVKGPELLDKYIGASEQAVRDIFSKAAAAAPCILFFDEFDSIAPKRGHDNTGVTDRVVNQFLTELDGVEVLTGVFVFAATSRPDLLDAALLRPGRLDRLLFCDFPSPRERLDILSVLSRKLPLAPDVDLEAIAYVTEGFSGADLQALLSDAQLAAVHEFLSNANSSKPEKSPIITDALLKSVASKARPSVSESEKQRLYDIYSQFLDLKRSAGAQSRDAKGKRATLA